MNFNQAQNYLLSLSNLPRSEYLKSRKKAMHLTRVGKLLELLGNPQDKIPHYIHVTGTSGKGSICLMLESILRESGEKTGLLISPHPTKITERWQINGVEMHDSEFCVIIEELKKALDVYLEKTNLDLPTFFELVTAVGLVYFAKNNIDWAILEAGLGGKNDSTNIIKKKDVAIITKIGLDHKDVIGPTKEDIAKEKTGIITSGCKVFTMEKDKKMLKIIEQKAKKSKRKLFTLCPKYNLIQHTAEGTTFIFENNKYELKCIGRHQVNNAILASTVACELGLCQDAIKKGLTKTILPIRMEVINRNPLVIIDGAHNPDKISTTVETISDIIQKHSKTYLIIGASYNKDTNAMIKTISRLKPTAIAYTRSVINPFRKVADPRILKRTMDKYFRTAGKIFLNSDSAMHWIFNQVDKNDLVLITGSIFLSGEIKKKVKNYIES